MLAAAWVIPLWTTVAGGVTVILCQQTYKGVARWQEARKDVDDRDHQLLHEMAAVMMDQPGTLFSKASPGLITRFNDLETVVHENSDKLEEVAVAVGQILDKVK